MQVTYEYAVAACDETNVSQKSTTLLRIVTAKIKMHNIPSTSCNIPKNVTQQHSLTFFNVLDCFDHMSLPLTWPSSKV